ncbi:MAG: DEAD/DEAH box helicase [Mariprofundus sp.]
MHDFPEITEQLIQTWLGERVSMLGRSLFKRHGVLSHKLDKDGSLIIGLVRDSNNESFSVLVRRLSHDRIKNKCECLKRSDCSHVGAVLHAILAERKQSSLFDEDELDTDGADTPVPPAFGMWLGMLDKVNEGKPVTTEYPDNIKQRLLYILEADGDKNIRLSFVSARILKSGGYGISQPYEAANILTYPVPKYVLADDEKILREVATDRSLSSLHGYRIKGPEGLSILKRALQSGRCHWQNKDTPALKRGERRHGAWGWKLNSMGDQYLSLQMKGCEMIVPTSPPWYIDPATGSCGPVESGQPADVAEILLNIAPVELDCSDASIQAVARQLPAGVPAPVHLQHDYRRVEPVPVITLKSVPLPRHWGSRQKELCHVAELMFDYDGRKVVYSSRPEPVRMIRSDKVIDYARDPAFESKAVESLEAAGLYPKQQDGTLGQPEPSEHLFILSRDDSWPEWMLYEIPALQSQGFSVEVADDFGFRVEHASTWELNLDEGESGAPGSLMGQASFMVTLDGGEEIDLIDVLARWVGNKPELLKTESLAQLRGKTHVPLPLPDGRLLPAPGDMVANILHFMIDVFAGGKTGDIQLSAPQMLALETSISESAAPVRINSSTWLKQMRKLADIGNVPVCDVPATLQAELRDYQREGLSWMQFLRQMNLAGILADDMGLGKTVQALAHILTEKEQGRLQTPALVLAPTSLMHNWRREAEKFAPGLSVLVLHGPERARHFEHLAAYDLVLTTYPLLARDFEALEVQSWHMLILDEAQYIKNPRAKVSQLVRRLQALHKLCMTGTPMENHLGELWAQFDFLMPGYLHDVRGFSKLFRKPIEIQGDTARQDALNVRLRPFMLRRSKEDVALELPPKTEMIRSVEIEGPQRELYESVRLAMQKRVRDAMAMMGSGQSQIVVLDALLKMRQVCCDPRLVNGLQGEPPASAKLQMLMEMLPEMIEEGRRVLLFSQFTSMLKLIEQEVTRHNIAYVKLTGQTQDRQVPVESFQNEEVPLFLISLKAGGVGLNLTAADTVIHFDPWWNPAAETQATDRAHRIGQDKAVFVYKLITEGTVEEKILELQERKRELASAIHQQDSGKKALWTPEELDSLFAPLS